MAEEIAVESGRISQFEVLVTSTLTLDRVILYTVVHHSSTYSYVPNFIEIVETFLWADGHGRTDLRTHGRKDGREFKTGFIRLTPRSRSQHAVAKASMKTLGRRSTSSSFRCYRPIMHWA